MAQRLKTVEYSFPTNTSVLTAATRLDFTAIAVHIPETVGRTFKNVIMEVHFRSANTTAVNLTSWTFGVKLGFFAFDDSTVTRTIANSAEHQSYVMTRDITLSFQDLFGGGTSQDVQVGLQFGGQNTINHTVKLIITYEYDDSQVNNPTKIKTVKIPLESPTGLLTNTLTQIGTNQVPNLSTFLPEASVVIRDVFFEASFNECSTSTSAFDLAFALDADPETIVGTFNQELNSSCYGVIIWKRADIDTSSTHEFRARSTVTSRLNWLTVVMVVTYEYDSTTTTTVLNSITFPIGDVSGYIGGTTSSDNSKLEANFFIAEPGTITLQQSGVMIHFNTAATITGLNLKCGGQAYKTVTQNAGSITCGCFCRMDRVDSGAQQGAGLTIGRGKNTIEYSIYRTSTAVESFGCNLTGLLILNYTSGVSAHQEDVHNKTITWNILSDTGGSEYGSTEVTTSAVAPEIPETNYFINSAGYKTCVIFTAGDSAVGVKAQEAANEGWFDIYESLYSSDGENAVSVAYMRGRSNFFRWPGDPDTSRVDIETARKYKFSTPSQNKLFYSYMLLTYHNITFTASGTVSNYTGDGSGITVNFFRVDGNEPVGQTTTTTGGAFSFTWYDDVGQLYATARESDTKVGRSANAAPT